MAKTNSRKCFYPGSFDPVTYGHLDLIERARQIFDEVYVAVAVNFDKKAQFSVEERIGFLKLAIGSRKGIHVESFSGLTVEYARKRGLGTMIRGLRATSDFDYEFQMAITNRRLADDGMDTIFLMPSEKYFYISSRLIKEISLWGGDVSHFVPPFVRRALKNK